MSRDVLEMTKTIQLSGLCCFLLSYPRHLYCSDCQGCEWGQDFPTSHPHPGKKYSLVDKLFLMLHIPVGIQNLSIPDFKHLSISIEFRLQLPVHCCIRNNSSQGSCLRSNMETNVLHNVSATLPLPQKKLEWRPGDRESPFAGPTRTIVIYPQCTTVTSMACYPPRKKLSQDLSHLVVSMCATWLLGGTKRKKELFSLAVQSPCAKAKLSIQVHVTFWKSKKLWV